MKRRNGEQIHSETGNRGSGETAKGDKQLKKVGDKIRSYRDLRVYQKAMEAAVEIFELTKGFPPEEKYSMVDQMRRSSRSGCTNIAEACLRPRGNNVCICAS